jgi:hypothetical protein
VTPHIPTRSLTRRSRAIRVELLTFPHKLSIINDARSRPHQGCNEVPVCSENSDSHVVVMLCLPKIISGRNGPSALIDGARRGPWACTGGGRAARPGMFAAYAAWSALEIELQALATLATLAQISTPSAAHFLKSHQLLVQKFAADRDRQRNPHSRRGPETLSMARDGGLGCTILAGEPVALFHPFQVDDVMQRRQHHTSFRSCQFSYPLSLRGQVCEAQGPLPCFPSTVLSAWHPSFLGRVPVSPVPRRHRSY